MAISRPSTGSSGGTNGLVRQGNQPCDIDGLVMLAFGYLAIPNIIFVFGWYRWPIALLLACLLTYLILLAFDVITFSWRLIYSPAAWTLITAAGLVWAAFAGGSHFLYANHDWIIRDAVLGDLIRSDWPVTYKSADGMTLILRSAIGYFLPPALFGKLFGAAYLDIAIYLWTATGVVIFLALLPLPRKFGWMQVLGLVVTIFFSGMDFLGVIIATQTTPIFPLRLEWWGPLSYPSLTGQLLWAPNHSLPIWIGSLVVFRLSGSRDMLRKAAALLPLTLIWTPFAAVGLLPFVLMGDWKFIASRGWSFVPWRSIAAGIVVSLPIVLFLTVDIGSIAAESAVQPKHDPPANSAYQAISVQSYLIFISCEFLLLALALATHIRQARGLFAMAVLMLLALPLIRFGPSNDFLLRLSTPPLIVLLAVCLQTLLSVERKPVPPTMWIAWLFLVIGGHTAFNELWRAATFQRGKADYGPTLADRQGGEPAPHYVGRLDSSLVRQLLRTVPD